MLHTQVFQSQRFIRGATTNHVAGKQCRATDQRGISGRCIKSEEIRSIFAYFLKLLTKYIGEGSSANDSRFCRESAFHLISSRIGYTQSTVDSNTSQFQHI